MRLGRSWRGGLASLLIGLAGCAEAEPLVVVDPPPPAPYVEVDGHLTSWAERGEIAVGDTSQFGRFLAVTDTSLYVVQDSNDDETLFAFERDDSWAFRAQADLSAFMSGVTAITATAEDVWVGGGGRVLRYGPDLSRSTVLEPPANAPEFGRALATDGRWLAVGDPGFSRNRGRVLLYRVAAVLDDPIVVEASEPRSGARFGHAIALAGGRLLVGAPGNVGNPNIGRLCTEEDCRGAVHVFEEMGGGWSMPKASTGPETFDQGFGAAVSWLGDRAVVSSPLTQSCLPAGSTCRGEDTPRMGAPCSEGEVICPWTGQAYIGSARAEMWAPLLPLSDRSLHTRGERIAAGAGWIAVGSPSDPDLWSRNGDGTVWMLPRPRGPGQDVLLRPNWYEAGMRFGEAVAVSTDGQLFVGAPDRCGSNVDETCAGRGAVLVFAFDPPLD